ncbi:hypothetical protein AB0L85_32090 [Streptomyces sp. NPDC052051]|uniref:hypothetical protein n=1 Tax=Streptomyces sp. NPDC052051 TaxID=3154649 RepID=UPI00343AC245
MSSISHEIPPQALEILALPDLATGLLTAEQVRGATCVWCGASLNAETAIDFGSRSGTLAGVVALWYPRGCAGCIRKAALTEYNQHPRTCEQCVDAPALCDTRRTLRRLALEGRG